MKERFSRWFNKTHGRKGTLWQDRFKSVLVEDGKALRTMAAYIDLNAVRAGLAEDPKDYRWSGYAEAVAGSKRIRRGLCRVRYFTDGLVLGSRGFVESVFEARRDWFGEKRKDGARPLPEVSGQLISLRDLHQQAIE